MDGILLINKEKNYTSRDVVNIVSKTLNIRKVGHTGTLDPLATGVLAICIGKATKLVEMLTEHDKVYIATITLGITSDTLDLEGEITNREIAIKTKEEIESALIKLTGTYEQEVPLYSAIRVAGRKLYEYAREDISIELPKREVQIKTLDLIGDITYENNLTIFKVKCSVSKGTYIRSLVRDIAYLLNTIGLMSDLERISVGDYQIDDSISINEFKIGNYVLKPLISALANYKYIIVIEELEQKIRNGQIVDNIYGIDELLFVNKENIPLGIYRKYDKDESKLKPWKMFV